MAAGYPVVINEVTVNTIEALYQALRFPCFPEIQESIIKERSPMAAKFVAKRHKVQSRADWNRHRVSIMRWCLQLKLAFHWHEFGCLLESTQNKNIVEESTKDAFWGAIAVGDAELEGVNALGRLLMELRDGYINSRNKITHSILPPSISDFTFLGNRIDLITVISETASEKPNPVKQKNRQIVIPGFDD